MKVEAWSFLNRVVAAAALASCGLAVSAHAQTFTTLASFDRTNGNEPASSVIQGLNGNLYGATLGGGNGYGTIYELPTNHRLTTLYDFCSVDLCADGIEPTALILGSEGDFYGVTGEGGDIGVGTVFRLTADGEFTRLFSLSAASNSGFIAQGLIQAGNGDLYVASLDGAYGGGAVFEVTPTGDFRVLHDFCLQKGCTDGGDLYSAPIQGVDGNFYGATWFGGNANYGVLYELTPDGSYTVLYSFCAQLNCADGSRPNSLVQDSRGNIYGTTLGGGAGTLAGFVGNGTVFEFTAQKQYVVLHSFAFGDGANPFYGLTLANDGNLYGTTSGGSGGGGNIFEITPAGALTVLYSFCDGTTWPVCTVAGDSGLFQSTDGLLYGTTPYGGADDDGTIYSFDNNLDPLVETVPTMGTVGAKVIILGNNLTGSSSVTFNGMAAAFTVESDTYISATVPAGATTGIVSVVTPTGTLNSNPQFVVTK
jgi:uncharacterized repeat protein (TIGR03803 family)